MVPEGFRNHNPLPQPFRHGMWSESCRSSRVSLLQGNPQMVQLLVEREKQEDEEMENEASPCLSKFARCFYRPLCDWKLLEMDSSKYVTSTF